MPDIANPILRGFNPDPSICRVGEDYYIATSTFEWFPGVQIHHSRDLANWRLITRPLTRAGQLDMRGDPDSCGVWAPALRHVNGLFHLIYTDVKRYGRTSGAGGAAGASLRDMHNYLVTAPTIEGPWSDPVHLNSSGFDPSLFADDDDGRMWMRQPALGPPARPQPLRRHRAAGVRPGGAAAGGRAAADLPRHAARPHRGAAPPQARRLLLSAHRRGRHGLGPCRDGGALAPPAGPYEVHPDGPLLTSRDRPDAVLQTGRPRRLGDHAGRRDLLGPPVRPAAEEPRPLHAGARDGDPAHGLGRGRLAAAGPRRQRAGR